MESEDIEKESVEKHVGENDEDVIFIDCAIG
jgi:hypothetical protein